MASLISDVLPSGGLCYDGPDAIGYAEHYSGHIMP
jgi:hypothetical protein